MVMTVVTATVAHFFALLRVEHDEQGDAESRHPQNNHSRMIQKNLFHRLEYLFEIHYEMRPSTKPYHIPFKKT